MPGTADHPFTGPEIDTIPLGPPPLERVVAQVRFSPVLAVADEAFAGRFQQALVDEYPIARSETELAISVAGAPETPPTLTPTRLWRFHTPDGSWRVSLATGFVALETTAYEGHEDFFGRLRRVLEATAEHVRPPQIERAGVRYVQRLADPADLACLAELVRPEVVGVAALHDDGAQIGLCLTQTSAAFDDVQLTARWGLLPAGAAFDPAVPAVETPSWVMDIDVFDERAESFDVETLATRLLDHSRRQYRFFRWAVEPAFLLRFGADADLVAAAQEVAA